MKIKNKLAVAICLIFVSQTLMSVSTNLTVVWPFETLDYSVPAQVINAGKSNDQQIKDGFINVTWYGADPSGVSDSTTAFQNAVNDSREYRYTLYIPTGTYLISDTIDCMQKVYRHPYNSNWMIGANKPIVIMGQYREDGKKPVLKLKTNSSGFNDTNNLKPLMQIWAQTINISPTNVPSTSITTEQANISFNNKLINVMIDINSAGSSGACGIRNASAQGTSIEDIIVIASNGFAGFYNMPGPSGGYYNIAVYGGKYGIYAKYAERSTIAGAVFEYQTEAAIYEMCMGYCLIGFRIVTLSGNAVKCPYNYGWKDSGPILVDGSITMANGGRAIDNLQGFTTYVKNVYFYNAGEIIKSGIDPIVSGIINKWCKIEEYSYAQKDNENDTNHGPATNCSDGIIGDNTLCKIIDNCLVPPADLVSRHIWDETSFPHYGMKSIINVQKDLGAKGDGASDDTAALQNAFTNYRYVFIPRGKYKIRNQLILGKNTRVIGAGSVYSLICPDTNYWKPSEYIPLIATEDSAAGDAALAYIGIQLPSQFTNIIRFGAIDWRVGRNSIIRSIKYSAIDWTAIDATNYFIIYRVTGSGGGKFFGIEAGMLRHSYHPDHRGFLAENTREPLNLYSLNVERNQGDYQAEFNNCKNIQVYFSKSENNRPFLMITNCKNISVFGYGGNGCPWTNRACIEVFNSDHITLGGIVPFCPTSPYDVLYPLDPGAGYKIDPLMDYSVTENYFGNINQLVKKVPAGILKRGNSVTSTPNVLPLLSDNFSMVIPGYILETGISLSDGKLICTDTSATRNVKWGDPDMSCIKTECTIKV
ncbi:MAG TPA: hypothetical protein DC049_08745, partial [Spirochaetia bacterium]|nr:hypothetical protein [Spirochaetia bacterium]